ncbi:HD domain-containing protein [Blastopirellula marina]|uniref:Metal-dependent phosphohydrolase n=1 Tax=Blastopirellula marina TaxID=124 RepID=A0A2S8GCH1_9BACT|nr:HD domain-containing protein [Blastopirellula marina]PQO42129.1 metal-dependent phosphohydrolase [Blastopirellula marina]
MSELLDIPEVVGLQSRSDIIRIPPELDVPLTPRVRHLVDTAEFRRLVHISQLGLVSLVFPAAHHSRFEHSLGVYRMMLLYLQRLAHVPAFSEQIETKDAELMIVAALLHDLGHWPFCHPIEDMRLTGVPQHELFANSFLLEGEVADCLREDWQINPRDVVSFLSEKGRTSKLKLMQSIISGPIDVDKLDYLQRDSLHAGVPYGRHFDQQRLIASLSVNKDGDRLALTSKGRTAAEMMVFARYVMFSEVYWHHAVRSATAMLQRAFFMLRPQLELDSLFRLTERPMIDAMLDTAGNGPASDLLAGLFGPTRKLYKRLFEYSFFDRPELFHQIARRPYDWLVDLSDQFATTLSRHLARRVAPHEILIDAPPVKLEVQFNIDVHEVKAGTYRSLGDVSPMVETLAKRQFDDYVKKVRIFVHPRLQDAIEGDASIEGLFVETVQSMFPESG